MNDCENWYDKYRDDERADVYRGDIQGLVPFFILVGILFVAFLFYLFT